MDEVAIRLKHGIHQTWDSRPVHGKRDAWEFVVPKEINSIALLHVVRVT